MMRLTFEDLYPASRKDAHVLFNLPRQKNVVRVALGASIASRAVVVQQSTQKVSRWHHRLEPITD